MRHKTNQVVLYFTVIQNSLRYKVQTTGLRRVPVGPILSSPWSHRGVMLLPNSVLYDTIGNSGIESEIETHQSDIVRSTRD